MKYTTSTTIILSALLSVAYAFTLQASEPVTAPAAETNQVVDEKCQAPKWAIAIGHEDKWKLHNGCTEAEADEPQAKTTTDKKPETTE